ncbi:MAG: aldo/keto reductase [Desulfobacula sp.]|jgi:aryl-alcohol dehydrogenase-like predicted oxidoreductase
MEIVNNRLVLGTAQLGMFYGIANKTGKPDLDCAQDIIKTAWDNGIREFDTAQGYGNSESVLGNIFNQLQIQDEARVITKSMPTIDHLDDQKMYHYLLQSLQNLGQKRLYCYMLHQEDLLCLWGVGLKDILEGFKKDNYIKKIGISVYSPLVALKAIKTEGIDCIQIPSNLLDRRFEESGVFQLADSFNKELYVRSIFLQGLILMGKDKIPDSMGFANCVASKIETLTLRYNLTRQQLAIGYVKEAYPTAKIIFGAETPSQISENLESWNRDYSFLNLSEMKKYINAVDDKILDPSKWA